MEYRELGRSGVKVSAICLGTMIRTKMNWLRKDASPGRQSRAQLIEALHGSLKRLNTDYIDLYQLHWPDDSRPVKNRY
jgi:aryl-alcohol dehydrogenase-like predicted oxidoreductase